MFALDEHVEAIEDGTIPPTPLALWVNEGDCVEVTLTNGLPEDLDDDHAHPQMRTTKPWERSNRISLHPGRIAYNVLGSDGATVGFNWDQTVAPGESITYRWFADEDIGTVTLWDNADIRSNRHHGAFGRIIVEPRDSGILDPSTAEPAIQGLTQSCMLKTTDGPDRREFALALADGQYIVNPTTDVCVVPPGEEEEPENENEEEEGDAPCNQIPDDPEDQGYVSINYRAEPFIRRFDENPDPSQVYDSDTHGDPATPLLQALVNDPIVFRVHQLADKARGVSFHLAGHQWNRTRMAEFSEDIGVDDRFIVGRADRLDLLSGAGGETESTGDFIYQELKQRRRLEAGFWGIMRVRGSLDEFGARELVEQPDTVERFLQPLPDRATELSPEEHPGWTTAYGDVTGDGTEDVLIGVPGSNIGGPNAGAAYLFTGPAEEPITDLMDANAVFVGGSDDLAGVDVAITDATDSELSDVVIQTGTETTYVIPGDESPEHMVGDANDVELLETTTNTSIDIAMYLPSADTL